MNILTGFLSAAVLAVLGSAPDQSRDLEHRSAVKAGERIEIRGLSGSEIEFTSWDKDEVVLSLHVRMESSDEEYEQDYIKSLEIREERRDGAVMLEFRELERGTRSGGFWRSLFGGSYVRKEIRGEVFVPRSNPLMTDLRYGSIALSDMKGEVKIQGKNNRLSLKNCSDVRKIDNDYGTSTLEHCGGNLVLSGTSSTITVDSHQGELEIEAKYSTIEVQGISKYTSIRSQSGRVNATGIGGDLKIQADYTTIKASDVKGAFEVQTKSGSVQAKRVEAFTVDAPYTTVEITDVSGRQGNEHSISGQSGTFVLENIKGNIAVDGPYTNIDLRKVQGSVNLRSKSSNVTAGEVSGDWKSQTEYCSLRIKNLKAKVVEIINKSNPVTVELLTVPEKIDIRNEYGSVRATLPAGFSGEIALDAEYGKVETDFPIRVRERGSSSYGIGTVGTGKGTISIETKSGNIELVQK